MSARLVQIYLPEDQIELLAEILPRHARRFWREAVPGGQEKYSCIVQQRYTERLLEELDAAFGAVPTFTAYVAQLEAVMPPVEETPDTELPLQTDLPPPTALERFFSTSVSINSFTETVLRSSERGVIKRWAARIGQRAIV